MCLWRSSLDVFSWSTGLFILFILKSTGLNFDSEEYWDNRECYSLTAVNGAFRMTEVARFLGLISLCYLKCCSFYHYLLDCQDAEFALVFISLNLYKNFDSLDT